MIGKQRSAIASYLTTGASHKNSRRGGPKAYCHGNPVNGPAPPPARRLCVCVCARAILLSLARQANTRTHTQHACEMRMRGVCTRAHDHRAYDAAALGRAQVPTKMETPMTHMTNGPTRGGRILVSLSVNVCHTSTGNVGNGRSFCHAPYYQYTHHVRVPRNWNKPKCMKKTTHNTTEHILHTHRKSYTKRSHANECLIFAS